MIFSSGRQWGGLKNKKLSVLMTFLINATFINADSTHKWCTMFSLIPTALRMWRKVAESDVVQWRIKNFYDIATRNELHISCDYAYVCIKIVVWLVSSRTQAFSWLVLGPQTSLHLLNLLGQLYDHGASLDLPQSALKNFWSVLGPQDLPWSISGFPLVSFRSLKTSLD